MLATKSKKKAQTYATPALEKGLDVIELLSHHGGSLTKSEIARELQRSVSEIFRMLICLERRGYIAQIDGDRYCLTLKMFKLVQLHPPTERLITEAYPVMHRLSREVHQSCHLGVVEGARVTILAQVNALTDIGFYVRLGSTVDIMDAASGYVILAHQQPADLARTLNEWCQNTGKKSPRDLDVHLRRIRETGYEKRDSYLVRGVVNISFPIFDTRHSAVGALTVPYISYNSGEADMKRVTASVRRAAEEINRATAGQPGSQLP